MSSDEQRDRDDEEIPSGLPEGEQDTTPLGVDEDADAPETGEDAMPGIAKEDEPEVSG